MELLKRDYFPSAAGSGGTAAEAKHGAETAAADRSDTADDKQLLEIVVNYYHETLKQSPEAQQYLVKRGLQSAEMVEHFRLGFANRTLGYHLPDKNRVAGAEQRGRLQSSASCARKRA